MSRQTLLGESLSLRRGLLSPFYPPPLPTDYAPYLRYLIKKDRLSKTEEVERIMYKDIKFAVFKGALEREDVDVIVNSTSENLKLTFGQCSRALLEAAGREIQGECDEKYPSGVRKGDVAITGPGKLKCKIICHGSLIHMQFISNCLMELDRHGFSTIALPALTTGFLKFPRDLAARNACRAVKSYIDANPKTNLKKVHFVIHHSDTITIQVFADVVNTLDLDQKAEISRRLCSCKISVLVKVGILEDEKAKFDMVVNFVGSASIDATTRTKHDVGEAVFNCLTEANRTKMSSIVFILHKSDNSPPPKIVSNAICEALDGFSRTHNTNMNVTVVIPEPDGRYSHPY